jgi:hypothetical protein
MRAPGPGVVGGRPAQPVALVCGGEPVDEFTHGQRREYGDVFRGVEQLHSAQDRQQDGGVERSGRVLVCGW